MTSKKIINGIYSGISKIKGNGVFASKNFKKGERILTFQGKKIDSSNIHKANINGRDFIVDPLQISDKQYLNLDVPYVLINHSCDPNAGLIDLDLIAIKGIKKGSEITFDYSTTWFDGFRCNCQSKKCRGHIGDFTSIPKAIRKRYVGLGIIPKFILSNFKD